MYGNRLNISKFILLLLNILIIEESFHHKNLEIFAGEQQKSSLTITEVKPSVVMDTPNICRLGSMVKIEVRGEFQTADIEEGTVRIASVSARYDSGSKNLTISEDSGYFFYHWDTWNLQSADDYTIEVTLTDKYGETVTNSDTVITLKSKTPEPEKVLTKNIDLYLSDCGISLHIVRSYKTYSTSNGVFGNKWTHSYNMNLTEWPDGTVMIFDDLGGQSWYVSNGDGTYRGRSNDHTMLSKKTDSTFQRKHKHGKTEYFDSNGKLTSISDPNNNSITFKYNKKGLLTSIYSPSGRIIRLYYDSKKRISSIVAPNGRKTTYQYDTNGNLVTVTNPAGFSTKYAYDSNNRLITITDAKGYQANFTYDEKDNLITEKGEGGNNTFQYKYNQTKPEVTVTDALGQETVINYDERGEYITSVEDSLGNITYYAYDENRNLTKLTDANGNEVEFSYDEDGNLVSYEDSSANITTFAYETEYNKISALTDALKRVTQFWYDSKGNLTEITFPDNSYEKYEYDNLGNLAKKTNKKGQTIIYQFSSRGELKKKTYPDTSSISYTYDSVSNLHTVKDKNGIIKYKYDALNRVVKVTYPKQETIQYSYDSNGNRSKIICPDGSILKYFYDEVNRLIRIKNSSGEVLVKYEYDKMGNRTRKELVNGVYTTYTYDTENRLTELVNKKPSGEIISSFQYTYDKVGNRLTMTTENGSYSYTYDNNYQLTSVIYPDVKEVEYGYDSLGNRVSVAVNGERVEYLTNDLNQYTSVGGNNYEYDANGNLISSGENTSEYDYENRLVKAITTQVSVSYSYDPFGRRISKTNNTNGNTYYYLWTGNQVIMEQDKSRKKLATYVYGVGIDEHIVMQRNGTNYYYTQDGLGNVIDLIDPDENVIESYEYDVFGQPKTITSIGNPYMFTGREYEPETGVFYYRARYYEPTIGRFLNEDPAGFREGINLYSYVNNNPINFVDPSGMEFPPGPGPSFKTVLDFPSPPDRLIPQGPLSEGEGLISKGLLSPGPNGSSGDPTFLYLPKERIVSKASKLKGQKVGSNIIGSISVPYENSLVRGNVPVFGLAYGKDFKEYRVEYGEGKEPKEWMLIKRSQIPQTKDVTPADLDFEADVTIHGNLATWDTGLKSYVYLPDYPPDHPMDLNGVYTLRLVVVGNDGEIAEDRVTVEVGEAIPNAWGGIVKSRDKKTTLNITEQSLMDSFAVISIKPIERSIIPLSNERKLIGDIYQFRERGEKFTKDAILGMEYSEEALKGLNPSKLGIYAYNPEKKEWVYLKSLRDEGQKKIITTVRELSPYYAVFASNTKGEGSSVKVLSTPIGSEQKSTEAIKTDGYYLIKDTFEDDMGEWSNRNGDVGAVVSLDNIATYDDTYALKLTNSNYGGNFASNVRKTPFDAREYPIVQFDYKVPSDVKINFLVNANGRWYEIGFTDDPKDLKYKRVNIANIGRIEGVIADDNWHTARFNLYEMLRTKTRNHIVEEMVMADWDVGGYMKLKFGTNRQGATYYIDNFMLSKDVTSGLKIDNNILLVDNFNKRKETNLSGGLSAMFVDDGNYSVSFESEDIESTGRKGHSLRISYNVSKTGSFAVYVTQLQNLDAREYKTLSFNINGSKGGEVLKVGIKDKSGNENKVLVNNYLSHGITTTWQKVEVPLVAFFEIKDWKGLDNLNFSFENIIGSNEGIVFIDDIQFKKDLNSFIVENFNKESERNLLGGRNWTFSNGACAINGGYNKGYSNKAYRLSYGGNIGDLFTYAGWTTQLQGIDVSQCNALSFNIKGAEGGEEPNVYLDDGNHRWGVEVKKCTRITTSWEKVSIPLNDFSDYGVDLTHIEEFQIVFEWKRQSGTVFIDNICFESSRGKKREI